MLKASVEEAVGRLAMVKWKWTNQVGSGRKVSWKYSDLKGGSFCSIKPGHDYRENI